ncbi:glycosyltransferase [Mucilaginibacter mallensis]|uniref:Glycosyltransferase n=1 Tax=Mucilaginibacter mallensis TaxID=652787 RepID=A0A1H2ABN1_MUCMA|nr:glycosyltransferase [Mucilaginibacter mallensis]SDT43323.1 glycosyltransferase [Mucilaginibacter mallensis]
MKVYFIETTDKTQRYGIGSYVNNLIPEFKDKDIDFNYVHINSRLYNSVVRTKKASISHIHIPVPINGNSDIGSEFHIPLLFARGIYTIISRHTGKSEKFVLHLNSVMQTNIGVVAKDYSAALVVYTMHILLWRFFYKNDYERFILEWNNRQDNKESHKIDSLLEEKKLCEIADKVICLTDDAYKFVIEIYQIPPSRVIIINNGLNANILPQVSSLKKKKMRRKLGFNHKDKILLYVGRLNQGKGLEFLIDAFHDVLKVHQNTKLIIVGNGNFDMFLSRCSDIWSRVLFTGYLDKSELSNIYNIADIGVLPSLNEQNSFVALEMMAHRLPIIASDIEGFKNILHDKTSCLKIKMVKGKDSSGLDIYALTKSITTLINDESIGARLSNNAYNTIIEEFNSKTMSDKLLMIYRELLLCVIEVKPK